MQVEEERLLGVADAARVEEPVAPRLDQLRAAAQLVIVLRPRNTRPHRTNAPAQPAACAQQATEGSTRPAGRCTSYSSPAIGSCESASSTLPSPCA
eukprot:446027-Prymnesium_polylepis.1